jgi:hypothetical protein
MPNYSDGKIYKIVCNTTGKCYIGSTAQKNVNNRLSTHKSNYKDYLKGKRHYGTVYDVLEGDNYEMTLVEICECENKYELLKRERHHIENNECVNKIVPSRTPGQYYEDHKTDIKIKRKQWLEENKERVKLNQKEYKQKNKETINEQSRLKYKRNKENPK